jgi:hypothetical protein
MIVHLPVFKHTHYCKKHLIYNILLYNCIVSLNDFAHFLP